jgi:hypothetical protein
MNAPSGAGGERRRPASVLDHRALVDALCQADVGFVVVGAFAVAAHGAVRGTQDLDICPDPDEGNLRRLADALVAIEARLVDAGEFEGELDVLPDLDGLKGGGNFRLDTKFGGLDLMQHLQPFGSTSWDRLNAGAEKRELGGHQILVAGYEDLLRMKRASKRPQDLIDVEDLRAARREL